LGAILASISASAIISCTRSHHFRRNRTFDDIADLLGDIGNLCRRISGSRRVGGDAVEQPQIVELTDILDVAAIDRKKFSWWVS